MLIGAGRMALVQFFRATPLCSDRLNRAEPLLLLVGRPGLDPGTLGLKDGSGQFLRSHDVEKVLNNGETGSLASAWFSGVRIVRGIK